MNQELFEKVENVLKNLRPYLQIDGGDVELVEITDDFIVKVKLLGACYACPLNLMTLRAGIERKIMKEIPLIKRLENVG
ncbi:MAG: NifU family protein [Ignavibacteriae bacterium]|nr:NifU family protein [Ignavibacteriota bacterium]